MVENRKRARLDVEVRAVDVEFALVLAVGDEGERAQVSDRRLDALFFKRVELFRLGLELIGRDNGEPGLIEHRHPLGDEHCFGLDGGGLVESGFDAAAVGVAENDDVLYAQVQNRELDAGADAVELAADFIRRNEIGDVTSDEEFAGHGVENRLRVDTAVAAGDHHDFGALPVGGEFFVLVGVGHEDAVLEAAVAVRERLGEGGHFADISLDGRHGDGGATTCGQQDRVFYCV